MIISNDNPTSNDWDPAIACLSSECCFLHTKAVKPQVVPRVWGLTSNVNNSLPPPTATIALVYVKTLPHTTCYIAKTGNELAVSKVFTMEFNSRVKTVVERRMSGCFGNSFAFTVPKFCLLVD